MFALLRFFHQSCDIFPWTRRHVCSGAHLSICKYTQKCTFAFFPFQIFQFHPQQQKKRCLPADTAMTQNSISTTNPVIENFPKHVPEKPDIIFYANRSGMRSSTLPNHMFMVSTNLNWWCLQKFKNRNVNKQSNELLQFLPPSGLRYVHSDTIRVAIKLIVYLESFFSSSAHLSGQARDCI